MGEPWERTVLKFLSLSKNNAIDKRVVKKESVSSCAARLYIPLLKLKFSMSRRSCTVEPADAARCHPRSLRAHEHRASSAWLVGTSTSNRTSCSEQCHVPRFSNLSTIGRSAGLGGTVYAPSRSLARSPHAHYEYPFTPMPRLPLATFKLQLTE